MKTNAWLNRKITVYIGGDPGKNQAPEFTIEMEKPQFLFDSDKGTVVIFETK